MPPHALAAGGVCTFLFGIEMQKKAPVPSFVQGTPQAIARQKELAGLIEADLGGTVRAVLSNKALSREGREMMLATVISNIAELAQSLGKSSRAPEFKGAIAGLNSLQAQLSASAPVKVNVDAAIKLVKGLDSQLDGFANAPAKASKAEKKLDLTQKLGIKPIDTMSMRKKLDSFNSDSKSDFRASRLNMGAEEANQRYKEGVDIMVSSGLITPSQRHLISEVGKNLFEEGGKNRFSDEQAKMHNIVTDVNIFLGYKAATEVAKWLSALPEGYRAVALWDNSRSESDLAEMIYSTLQKAGKPVTGKDRDFWELVSYVEAHQLDITKARISDIKAKIAGERSALEKQPAQQAQTAGQQGKSAPIGEAAKPVTLLEKPLPAGAVWTRDGIVTMPWDREGNEKPAPKAGAAQPEEYVPKDAEQPQKASAKTAPEKEKAGSPQEKKKEPEMKVVSKARGRGRRGAAGSKAQAEDAEETEKARAQANAPQPATVPEETPKIPKAPKPEIARENKTQSIFSAYPEFGGKEMDTPQVPWIHATFSDSSFVAQYRDLSSDGEQRLQVVQEFVKDVNLKPGDYQPMPGETYGASDLMTLLQNKKDRMCLK
jgi:hypothetical protein